MVLKTYQLQGMASTLYPSLQSVSVLLFIYLCIGLEFRAVFVSTLEATGKNGAAINPTKSICDQYVFNTIITRAQSLVVCVGNPFLLLSIELHGNNTKCCWKEYLKRCLEISSFKVVAECRSSTLGIQTSINSLYVKVFGNLPSFLTSSRTAVHNTIGDSIMATYKKAFKYLPQCEKLEVTLKMIYNEDVKYSIENDERGTFEEENINGSTSDECYLQCESYKLAWAIPVNPEEDPIKIQGLDNRRQAFDGAHIQVSIDNSADRSGHVTRIIDQNPKRQYVCTVDWYNSIFFCPIDGKDPKFVNLPALSRELLLKAGNVKTIQTELEVKQHSVAVFDPDSFTNPNERKGENQNDDVRIPQISDVIPLNIARRLLFVVWYLNWEKSKRYPLGVVVAALPKGLTFFHAERFLCAQHNINTSCIEITPALEAELSSDSSNKGDFADNFNNAIIIEQPDVAFSIEFVKQCKDGVAQFTLGVHVANVARFIEMDSNIDKIASHRGATLCSFKPGGDQHTMLPPAALKKWSFVCGKLLSAISASCKMTFVNGKPALHPESTTIVESCVCPAEKLTLSEVQKIFDNQFSTNQIVLNSNTTEGKIGLLYQIAKAVCCKRLQCETPILEYKENPQAWFLVSELTHWMNRTIAEYMQAKPFPYPDIMYRQCKPNSSQLQKVITKHKPVLPFHPIGKLPLQPFNKPTMSMVFEQSYFRKFYEALLQSKYIEAIEILFEFQHQSQGTVFCKELHLIEPNYAKVCSLFLSQMSYKPKLSVETKLIVPFAHITSPLDCYMDIISQRLLLNKLNNVVLFPYSEEQIASLCKSCQIREDTAVNCKRSFDQLNLTLSLTECAQPFTAYVGTAIEEFVESANPKNVKNVRLRVIFPDPVLYWLNENQCYIALSNIDPKMTNLENFQYVWTSKMTFLSSVSQNVCQRFFCDESTATDLELALVVPNQDDNAGVYSIKNKTYSVKPNNPVVLISEREWSKFEEFMNSPCEANATPLVNALEVFYTGATSEVDISANFSSVIKSSSMWLYSGKLTIEPYKVLKVWLSASDRKPFLMPSIQLLEVAPFFNMCIQHNSSPASCFAGPTLTNASKVVYNSIEEYVSLWEDVLLAEAATQSIKEADLKVIHDVQLTWPALKQPECSLDDVYFIPDGKILLILPDEFIASSLDFFAFDVGDLVCVRYKVPLMGKIFDKHCTNYGLKNETGYVVFHMVVNEAERNESGLVKKIFLKFCSLRISSLMKDYLETKPYCELQLISLKVSHRYVTKFIIFNFIIMCFCLDVFSSHFSPYY